MNVAPRTERATRGQGVKARDCAANRSERTASKARRRAEQTLGVRVARMAQDFCRGAFLNDAAGVHHHHAIGNLRDDSQIVCDEKHRELKFAAQLREQFQDLLSAR